MKRIIYVLMVALMVLGYSCKKEDKAEPIYSVKVQLIYPNGVKAKEGVKVVVTNTTNANKAEIKTNAEGIAVFELNEGAYSVMANEKRVGDFCTLLYNGTKEFNINNTWKETDIVSVDLTESKSSQLIVKELYTGGVPTDDGSKSFNYDRYIIIYNNSEFSAKITKDLALATIMPYNAMASNKYIEGGKLTYDAKGWLPAGQGVWYFNREVEVSPYSQIVIAITQAIDHTTTYSKSINFANSEYFCTYDPEIWNHKKTYVAPSELIPTTNYLKALAYGAGSAWCLSMSSPGFFIFSAKDVSLIDFVADASQNDLYGGFDMLVSKKVPREWVIDGVEVFKHKGKNAKRITDDVDAGSVLFTTKQGYSIYRNVDKEATEAIEGNKEKLVYSYALGTESIDGGSTDPSGIDAEASIKNGAKIIYKDTNNSTEDFHQRAKASLSNY